MFIHFLQKILQGPLTDVLCTRWPQCCIFFLINIVVLNNNLTLSQPFSIAQCLVQQWPNLPLGEGNWGKSSLMHFKDDIKTFYKATKKILLSALEFTRSQRGSSEQWWYAHTRSIPKTAGCIRCRIYAGSGLWWIWFLTLFKWPYPWNYSQV